MPLPIYQVDAFATSIFKGNPAAVMPLQRWLDDALLQSIAMENNLAETAFIVEAILASIALETLQYYYPNACIDLLVRQGNEPLFAVDPFWRAV